MNILIVDDDQAICIYLSNLLEKWGYGVFSCHSAEQAWQFMQENTVNLVLTDWMMPGLSGVELSKRIRDFDYSQYIYIIILTGRSEKNDVVTGIDSGADDFLTKPINSQELQVRLKAAQRVIALEQSLKEKNNALSQANIQIKNNLKILKTDLEAAANLQKSLLPESNIADHEIETAWSFQPADDLGGDFIGFYPLSREKIGFYVLDVSGHGIPAAMLSVYLHNRLLPEKTAGNLIYSKQPLTQGYVIRSPAEIVTRLNQDFNSEKHNNLYFTVLYGVINKYTGEGQFCQAGHPYPLICNSKGLITSLGKGGFPVGLMDEVNYENIDFKLDAGDKMLLYSDGITESMNETEEQYGITRLGDSLAENRFFALPKLIENLKNTAQQWQNSEKPNIESFNDDLSLFILEKK